MKSPHITECQLRTGSMWYYGAGEMGPFTNNGGAGGASKDCDLIKKCVTGVELDDGVGDAMLFGDCGDENNMKANVRGATKIKHRIDRLTDKFLLHCIPYLTMVSGKKLDKQAVLTIIWCPISS